MSPRIPSFGAETARKVAYRIRQRLRSKLNRRRADPFQAELSDRAFLQALDGSFDSVFRRSYPAQSSGGACWRVLSGKR
jgi:hypothetical protein